MPRPAVPLTTVLPAAGWFAGGLGLPRYALLILAVAGQATTVVMTWPLWQLRTSPPHLPVVELPAFPFGWLLVASLGGVLIRPRWGIAVHALVLAVACLADQFRTQPQFFALAMLIWACASETGARLCRWQLATLWLWAGVHKGLSPDWFAQGAWDMAFWLGLDPERFYPWCAWGVAAGEMFLGVLAAVRPRLAAPACVAMHLGVAVYLSPWVKDWNPIVLPWNVCSAIVGAWVLWNAPRTWPRAAWERLLVAAFAILPAGFYQGWMDHGVASVLYSDNLPRGLITTADGSHEIEGWGKLRVPFPNERRLLRMHFERVAQPGDKLHIADPRPWLDDLYYVQSPAGQAVAIAKEEFFAATPDTVQGVGLDSTRSMFALSRASAKMLKLSKQAMIYAVEIPPKGYRPGLLEVLAGLPNLEQVQLAGCPIHDHDFIYLENLPNLTGVGLRDTLVTEAGLAEFAKNRPGVRIER